MNYVLKSSLFSLLILITQTVFAGEVKVNSIKITVNGSEVGKEYIFSKDDVVDIKFNVDNLDNSEQLVIGVKTNKLVSYKDLSSNNSYRFTITEEMASSQALSLKLSYLKHIENGKKELIHLDWELPLNTFSTDFAKVSLREKQIFVNDQDVREAKFGDKIFIQYDLEDSFSQKIEYIYSIGVTTRPKENDTPTKKAKDSNNVQFTTKTLSHTKYISEQKGYNNSIRFNVDDRFKDADKISVKIQAHNGDKFPLPKDTTVGPLQEHPIDFEDVIVISLNEEEKHVEEKSIISPEEFQVITPPLTQETLTSFCGTFHILHYLEENLKNFGPNTTKAIGITDDKCEVNGFLKSDDLGEVSTKDIKVKSVGRFYPLPKEVETATDLIDHLKGKVIKQKN